MDSQNKNWTEFGNNTRNQSLISLIGSLILMVIISGLVWSQIQEQVEKLPCSIMRNEWGAPPLIDVQNLEFPLNRVIITTTRGAECRTRSECIDCVRTIEFLEFDSLIVNFLVGGDGLLYEGYGFNQKVDNIKKGFCNDSIGIALIGSFLDGPPPEKQLYALKSLLKSGVPDCILSPNYKMYAQKELVANSGSFEKYVVSVIREWPHFAG